MEQGIGLLFIYFIFSVIIFNEMYKENKKLREDKEELLNINKNLQYDIEDLMERFVPKD
ncbi:hypothetical protein OAS63_06315 [Gammaproteobacteria bacterium]|jgi:hypothetical protein|nr:hypothetical protein [Gammaproteobacteria bacterium]